MVGPQAMTRKMEDMMWNRKKIFSSERKEEKNRIQKNAIPCMKSKVIQFRKKRKIKFRFRKMQSLHEE